MTDERRRAIAAEIAAAIDPPEIADDEITVQDWWEVRREESPEITYAQAAGELDRAWKAGRLKRRKAVVDSKRKLVFRKA